MLLTYSHTGQKVRENRQPKQPDCSFPPPLSLWTAASTLGMAKEKDALQTAAPELCMTPSLVQIQKPKQTKVLKPKHWQSAEGKSAKSRPVFLVGAKAAGLPLHCLWARNGGNWCSRAAWGRYSLPWLGKAKLPYCLTAIGREIPMHLTPCPLERELNRMQLLLSLYTLSLFAKPEQKRFSQETLPTTCDLVHFLLKQYR